METEIIEILKEIQGVQLAFSVCFGIIIAVGLILLLVEYKKL